MRVDWKSLKKMYLMIIVLFLSIVSVGTGEVVAAPTAAMFVGEDPQDGTTLWGTIGWSFTPQQDIWVASLGYWDHPAFTGAHGGNGFATSHEVAIFDSGIPASPIASATVFRPICNYTNPTCYGTYNYFAYTPISNPVKLIGGREYVIAALTGTSDYYSNSGSIYGYPPYFPPDKFLIDPLITYNETRYDSSTSLVYPSSIHPLQDGWAYWYGPLAARILGPSFEFDTSGPPGMTPGTYDINYGTTGNATTKDVYVVSDSDPSNGSIGVIVGAEVFAYGGSDPVTQTGTAYANGTLPFTVDTQQTLYLNVDLEGFLGGSGNHSSRFEVNVRIEEDGNPMSGVGYSDIKDKVYDGLLIVGPVNLNIPYTANPNHQYTLVFSQTLHATASLSESIGSADFMGTSFFSVGANIRPIADAGIDQITDSSPITLDGSGSNDPDNNLPLIYQWSIADNPLGSSPAISDLGVVNPSVYMDLEGTYIFGLEVTDSLGLTSLRDQVKIEYEPTTIVDTDGDNIADDADNCINIPNTDQFDADGDGLGDACDACPDDLYNDADGDGICGDVDNCPDSPNSNQADFDEDGIGDECDPDDDDDGVSDNVDNCPFAANADQADADGDGAGDVCDTDDDNDGVLDAFDECINTAFGEIVNNFGCSISDLCPCDNDWKNHGGYVKCVAHTSEEFMAAGLITEAEKDLIVSGAAQSDCGSKK